MSERELAELVLHALATSDLERVRELASDDVVVFGTDVGERWDSRESLVDALESMRALGLSAEWSDDLRAGSGWLAGTAVYRLSDGSRLPTRVSLVFEEGRLVHGHFSVAQGA
jgi:hypothetical protein